MTLSSRLRAALLVLAAGCGGAPARIAQPAVEAPPTPAATPSADPLDDVPAFVALKDEGGYLLLINDGDVHAAMHVTGGSYQELELPPEAKEQTIFGLDGRVTQLIHVSEVQLGAPEPEPDEARLRRHMVWETSFLSRDIPEPLIVEHKVLTVGGRALLAWWFVAPDATWAQLHVTAADHGDVVGLIGVVESPDELDAAIAHLSADVATIRFSATLIDPKAEQAALRARR